MRLRYIKNVKISLTNYRKENRNNEKPARSDSFNDRCRDQEIS